MALISASAPVESPVESVPSSEALEQSHEQLKLVMAAMDEGIADWDIASDKYAYSNRYCQLLGYSPGSLEQGHDAWIASLHCEERALVVQKLSGHLKQEIPFDVECRVRTKGGEYHWFRFRGQAAFNEVQVATRMVKTISDITAAKQMETELIHSRDQLQKLASRLLETQETERKHIARELHDEVGQVLTAIKLNLQSVKRTSGDIPIPTRLNDSIQMVEELLSQVRNLSRLLRPPQLDALGLPAALEWYVEHRLRSANLTVHLICDPLLMRLRSDLETNCFRIVQETLTNVLRHAKAKRVSVVLRRYTDSLQINVNDDGIGFDVPEMQKRTERGECLGLFGIEERAKLLGGHVTINSVLDEGTDIHVAFPLLLAKSRSRATQRRGS